MGKQCNGVPTDTPTPRNSRAYCEGRDAAAAGALIGTNPHFDGVDGDNWARGHASWTDDPAGGPPGDCCATPFGGGYTP